MVRQTATQKAKTAQKHQCGSCGEIFSGKICPNCEEKMNIFPINADGLPSDVVADAVGSTHALPITLQRSPEIFDPEFELEAATKREMKDVMQEAQLNKVRAAAAIQAEKRLRAEKALEAAEQGFMPPKEGEQPQEEQNGFASMSPGIFLQALGGWDPEQREQFLNQLASNPMLALNLSMMMNPGKTGGMNQMGMGNPLAMMGQMMQPPAEQAPQANATEMVTAMIAGMQALQEMGGGNKSDNSSMDRILDKMDEMRRETEELRLRLTEAQNKPTEQLSTEDIRRIVADVMTGATSGKMGLLNGLQEIHAVSDELIGLGIVQKPSAGIDPEHSIAERKLTHEIKMDEKRETREHEMRLETERSVQAAAETKGEFIHGLFAAAQSQQDQTAEEEPADKPTETVVEASINRPSAVIS